MGKYLIHENISNYKDLEVFSFQSLDHQICFIIAQMYIVDLKVYMLT